MNKIEKTNKLSFYNDNGILTLSAKQYDTGRKFVFNIIDNDEPFDLTGCTAYLRMLKADGTQFQGEECCSIDGNSIIVDTSVSNGDQILACAGANTCELHLTDSEDNSLTTWDFVIDVMPRVHNGDHIESTDSFDILDDITEVIVQFEKSLNAHISDGTIHITAKERSDWDAAKTHADSVHAPSDAEANQNAFSNIVVDSTTISANSTTDAVEIVGGENVKIIADKDNKKITLSSNDTTTTTSRELTESQAGGIRIISMDGESQQKQYTGKNLLQNDGVTKTVNGVTFTVNEDKSVTINGTAAEQTTFIVKSSMTMNKGKYVFAKDYRNWSVNCGVDQNKDGKFEKVIAVHGSEFEITDENIDRTYSFYIRVIKGVTVNNLTVYPLLRKSSDDDTYEPHVGGVPSPNPVYPQGINSVEVSEIWTHGKNLFDYTEVESSWYKPSTSSVYRKVFKLKPNTSYTISASVNAATGGAYCFIISGNNLEFGAVTASNGAPAGNPRTVITDSNGEFVVGTFLDSGVAVSDSFIQLEEGSVATEYEPYTETRETLSAPIVLRGIGSAKDVLCKQNGVFGVLRNIYNNTYKGGSNETWYKPTSANAYRIINSLINVPPNNNTITNALCSHFISDTINKIYNTALDMNGKFGIGTNGEIVFRKDDITTLEAWKSWIASNNVTIQGVLKTPTFEPLPLADQIALHKLETFGGVTYVYTDSTIEPIITLEHGTSKVGGYAIKGMNDVEVEKLLNDNYITKDETIPIAQGGTGYTTAKGAEYAILGAMPESTAALTDNAIAVFKKTSPNATDGVTVYKKMSLFWNYINDKIKTILGLTATNYNGTSAKATADASGNNIANTYATKTENSKKYDSTTSRTANTVLAAPNGSNGAATFRTLVSADLPTIPATKGGSGKTTLADSANAYINALTEGTSTPTDDDYMITQYASGGTTNTTYHRRKMSTVFEYFKSKFDSLYLGKSATASNASRLSNTSAIGSATKPVYFNADGVPVAGTYTLGAACAKSVSTTVTSGSSNLVTSGAVYTALDKYAVKSHASSGTGFGKADVGLYGHVSISDNYATTPSVDYNASAGVAASLYTVQSLYKSMGDLYPADAKLTVKITNTNKLCDSISWTSGDSSTFNIYQNFNNTGGGGSDEKIGTLNPYSKEMDFIIFDKYFPHTISITNTGSNSVYLATASSSSNITRTQDLSGTTKLLTISANSTSSVTVYPEYEKPYFFYSAKNIGTNATHTLTVTVKNNWGV